jgi:hypothetical protein
MAEPDGLRRMNPDRRSLLACAICRASDLSSRHRKSQEKMATLGAGLFQCQKAVLNFPLRAKLSLMYNF